MEILQNEKNRIIFEKNMFLTKINLFRNIEWKINEQNTDK